MDKFPEALGSVIRSKFTNITLVKLRAGWVNFDQSVAHHPNDPENWVLLYDNGF